MNRALVYQSLSVLLGTACVGLMFLHQKAPIADVQSCQVNTVIVRQPVAVRDVIYRCDNTMSVSIPSTEGANRRIIKVTKTPIPTNTPITPTVTVVPTTPAPPTATPTPEATKTKHPNKGGGNDCEGADPGNHPELGHDDETGTVCEE